MFRPGALTVTPQPASCIPGRKMTCNGITAYDSLYCKRTTATRTDGNRPVEEKIVTGVPFSADDDKQAYSGEMHPSFDRHADTGVRSSGQREGGGNEKKGEKTAISLKNTAFRFIRPGCSLAEPDQYHSV